MWCHIIFPYVKRFSYLTFFQTYDFAMEIKYVPSSCIFVLSLSPLFKFQGSKIECSLLPSQNLELTKGCSIQSPFFGDCASFAIGSQGVDFQLLS